MSVKILYTRKGISSLLVFSAIALLTINSLLLSPFTMSVFAQTETDAGDNDAATMASGAANDNTTTAAATATATGNNNNMTGVTFLFIQGAQSGSISEVNATTSTLELSDVSDKTIMFSDRPDRIVGSVSTTNFIGNWSMGPNNFAIDPPTAALILDDEEERQDIAVIELFNPEYDSEANTLRYDITAENATTTTTTTSSSIDLPSEFGQSTLVIDAENQQGPYVPGKQPNITGGVTKPQFQNDIDNGELDRPDSNP
jgi:hypothetical protein